MHKIWMYNPSTTFYVLFKVISMLFNAKYLARVRIIKKKNYSEFWEHMLPDQWQMKYGGNLPDVTQFWPPAQLDTDIVTREDIKKDELMTFSVLGDQGDKELFSKWEPLNLPQKGTFAEYDGGCLDKIYYQ